MLGWLRRTFKFNAPACLWSVRVAQGIIHTSDGQGTVRDLLIQHLRSVVVATDDSGPWGDDVVFLLYADAPDPVGAFPLEADGCQDFVAWLSGQAGYRSEELAKAMASTQVARFVVYEREL